MAQLSDMSNIKSNNKGKGRAKSEVLESAAAFWSEKECLHQSTLVENQATMTQALDILASNAQNLVLRQLARRATLSTRETEEELLNEAITRKYTPNRSFEIHLRIK